MSNYQNGNDRQEKPQRNITVGVHVSSREKRERREREEEIEIVSGMSEAEIERAIRKRIKQRIEKRNEFMGHLISYVAVNIGLWFIYLRSGDGVPGFPWPLAVMLFWGIGLFAHAMEVYQSSGSVQSRREAMIRREIDAEKQRMGLYEKPKRVYDEYSAKQKRPETRINEEGELVPLDELLQDDSDDTEPPRTMRRSGRG